MLLCDRKTDKNIFKALSVWNCGLELQVGASKKKKKKNKKPKTVILPGGAIASAAAAGGGTDLLVRNPFYVCPNI
jgi:hypothetical protein